jgi:hypothetical protein
MEVMKAQAKAHDAIIHQFSATLSKFLESKKQQILWHKLTNSDATQIIFSLVHGEPRRQKLKNEGKPQLFFF